MGYDYTFDTERNLVICTYSGRTTVEDTIACINEVLDDARYQPGMNAMSEYLDASGEWTLTDLDKFRTYIANVKKRTGKSRWAVVIPEGKNTATARIVVAIHNALDNTIEIQLFRDRDAAVGWLETTNIR